jgi:hypothetical protein
METVVFIICKFRTFYGTTRLEIQKKMKLNSTYKMNIIYSLHSLEEDQFFEFKIEFQINK